MKLSLVIPTYNEKGNIAKLLSAIEKEFEINKIDGEIIVVDDNSPDGTGQILENLKSTYKNLGVAHREGKLGLSSAVTEGLKMATGEILGVMDADLSHPTNKINEMHQSILSGQDLVIGSRYISGGKIEGWNWYRKLLSRGATILARIYVNVKDPMSGFFMVKKELIESAEINSKGFKILLEILIKTNPKKVLEIPITFVNRTEGKSKAGMKEIIFYLRNLINYLPYRNKIISEFFKFCTVGILGTGVNLLVLYFLTERLEIYYLISATFSFIIALSFNFLLNKVWTFKENMTYRLRGKYFRFFTVSLLAFCVNIFFLYIFKEIFNIHYLISQAVAIAIAFMINFIGNKIWTFHE